jgi:hypothetical protein
VYSTLRKQPDDAVPDDAVPDGAVPDDGPPGGEADPSPDQNSSQR